MPSIDRQTAFSGTKEVADALAIDAARLEAFLASRLPAFAGPLSVRQFKGGQSNPTYFLQTPARRYVLRRKPPGKLLPSAHAVDREFRVISALHARGFPVAAPLLYCDDAGIAGTPFYLMDHVEGRVVWEPHMPDAQPHERAAVYDAMNATLARLPSFDPAGLRPRPPRHPHARGICGRLCGAHRPRPTAASAGLSRLQFLPPGGDLPGHCRPGARRHRDERKRRRHGAAGAPARRQSLGVRARGGRAMTKSFALALGGGGARGLAHIAVLEALDDMGQKP